MKTLKTLTITLTLAAFALPSFASINYNASKSNTGNVAVQNTNQQTLKAKTYNASHSNTAAAKSPDSGKPGVANRTTSRSNTQHN